MPPEVWEALRVESAKRRVPMGEIVVEALQARIYRVTKHDDDHVAQAKAAKENPSD